MIFDWSVLIYQALEGLLQWFVGFVPSLLGAIVVLIIGWILAVAFGKVVSEVLIRLKFNKIFEKTGWEEAFAKAEIKVNPAEFLGAIVKWAIVLSFLMAAVNILNLTEFAGVLKGILDYLPNVFVSVLILVVAIVIADIFEKVVVAFVEKGKIGYSALAGTVVRWAIWIFAVLAILHQLEIVRPLVETFFTGLIAVFVISFGLAFGLGGKDVAAELLQSLKRKLEEK